MVTGKPQNLSAMKCSKIWLRTVLTSIGKYLRYICVTPFKGDARRQVLQDLKRQMPPPENYVANRDKALEHAIDWLLVSQKNMADAGFGSYHLINGWGQSYPETSGYIIPTLLQYAKRTGDYKIAERALESADWLLTIQKSSGGWQSMTMKENRPEIVFNTGQVIRGMIAAHQKTKHSSYLESAKRAADWLASIQNENGMWDKHVYMGEPRVYDSYVSAPLLDLNAIHANDAYAQAAKKNIDWILSEKQLENGWFEDCDNTTKRNAKPILHTIAYTIDGILDCGISLGDDKTIAQAKLPADYLLANFEKQGWLNGRYDNQWYGSEAILCTGCAQIAIVWLKLAKHTGEERYRVAAAKLIDQLVFVQDRSVKLSENVKGALPGSFKVWGRYEKFAYPNWATKYFADALMLLKEVEDV